MEIHVTDRQAFRRCRRKYQYGYVEHLKPLSESKSGMWFGRGGHYALAEHYLGASREEVLEAPDVWFNQAVSDEDWASMDQMSKTQATESMDLLKALLGRYLDHYEGPDRDWEILQVETPLRKKIPGTSHWLVGTIDLLVKWRNRIWVVDHKFYKDLSKPEDLELDDQMTAYAWLVRECLGVNPAGAIHNQIRKKLPSVPELLKSGTAISRAATDTDYAIYLREIERHGFDPADYAEVLTKLGAQDDRFFRRIPIFRNKHELDTFALNLKGEVKDMVKKGQIMYPNPNRDCGWDCEFRTLCKAENEGGDVDGLKKGLYQVNSERVI